LEISGAAVARSARTDESRRLAAPTWTERVIENHHWVRKRRFGGRRRQNVGRQTVRQ
jgi:hypothetical protein